MKSFWIVVPLLSAAALLGAFLFYAYREMAKQFTPPTPPLPEMLRGVTAGGGIIISCGIEDIEKANHSADLTARLRARFPAGSSTGILERYLRDDGFALSTPCPENSHVHVASFSQRRGGGLSYPATASVWWRDDGGSLSWITASIFYNGL